jgi:thymidylate synthase
MSDGFPLLTTKKMAWKTMVTELVWFLKGDTNIQYLVQNGCHIWDGDCYKAFHNKFPETEMMSKEDFIETIKVNDEFAAKHGNLGPIYGKQWRSWKFTDKFTNGEQIAYVNGKVDQIANLINELETNPDSRRLMVSAWAVHDLDSMVLPPCHYGFQMYTRELSLSERYELMKNGNLNDWMTIHYKEPKTMEYMDKHNIPTRAISLMWNQRSVDTALGLPMNIASYALLLLMIADEVNMVPDQLIGNLGDVHLYLDHLEGAKEQITRTPYELPTVHVRDGIESCMHGDFILKDYQSHPKIYFPLSN